MYKCISAPCCYQDPPPDLKAIPEENKYICPYCTLEYSQEFLDKSKWLEYNKNEHDLQ